MEQITQIENQKLKMNQVEEQIEQIKEIKEIWKLCDDFKMYEVSNLGKVRNKKTGRILKSSDRGGYRHVGLTNKNTKKKCNIGIHRLVAIAFIDNPENKPQVNHLDKNRSNNIYTNLEWTTAKENNIHRSTGVIQTTNQNIKVWRVDKNTNKKLQLFNSLEEARKWLVDNNFLKDCHTKRTGISSVIRGIQKLSYGFKWVVKEQENLENEEWRNVIINGKIYENYQVSNLGRFKNSKGIIMENYKPHHSGYIHLRVDKEKYSLHRLVAFAFLENPLNKPVVNHIDGNKINNAVSNLEWCTFSENSFHSHKIELIKTYKRKIGQYTIDGELVKEYSSIVEAMNETNVTGIKSVLYKKQNTSGGFIWKYLDENKNKK